MLELKYSLKNISPLSFTEKSTDSVLYATKRYIPGSALRGSLANLFINEKGLVQDAHKDQEFYAAFLSGRMRFLPAYPAPFGKKAILAPLSINVSKTDGRVTDFAAGNVQQAGFKKMSGFIVDDREAATITKVEPDLQFEFHMSRAATEERILGRSSNGSVFNYEYLEAGQSFEGSIIFDDELKPLVEKLVLMLEKRELRLGRSKNAQYGSVKVTVKGIFAIEEPSFEGNTYLYLYTPYIPWDASSRTDKLAKTIIDELNEGLNGKIPSENLRLFAGSEFVDGYVGTWNMKRERKAALSAGSLIELQLEGLSEADKATIIDKLYAGLGARTEEGFGQMRIWTPLQGAVLAKASKLELAKRELSSEVKLCAKKIIHSQLLEEVRKLAKEDALKGSSAKKCKGSLKNIEELMNSQQSKQSIQVNGFSPIARKNLRDTKLHGDSLLSLLLEEEGFIAPYAEIDWATQKLKLSPELARELEQELGSDTFKLPDDVIYKEYWLWFARHTAKNLKLDDRMNSIASAYARREDK